MVLNGNSSAALEPIKFCYIGHRVHKCPEERCCCNVGPGTALGYVNDRKGIYKDGCTWQHSLV